MQLKIGSLFAGCGGADLGSLGGFRYLGKKYTELNACIEYAVDIDQFAVETYNENFKHKAEICDVKDFSPSAAIDILIGGFPCQSFSTVNPTKDPFDERGQLYKEMARILRESSPKAFIAENVKGMMVLKNGQIFKRIVAEFEDAGYLASFKLLNASDYGVPQKRQRVFIVGIKKEHGRKFKFPEPTTPEIKVPISKILQPISDIPSRYIFSERAVQGMKNAKNNMKRGLAQNLDEPCLTITSHLAKASLNSRDPVLFVDQSKEIYRRFTPREAARIQSFPDSFKFTQSDQKVFKQIGNAIPPVLFWHIMKSLIDQLD